VPVYFDGGHASREDGDNATAPPREDEKAQPVFCFTCRFRSRETRNRFSRLSGGLERFTTMERERRSRLDRRAAVD
jgi:hypothetical protein